MNKIKSIRLKNFRGFRDSGHIQTAALTFLVGPNSSGKSSIADGILLVSQSMSDSYYWPTPEWMGRLVDLGSYKDAVYKHATQRAIEIEINAEINISAFRHTQNESQKKLPEIAFKWHLRSDSKSETGRLQSFSIRDVISNISVELQNLTNDISVNINMHRARMHKTTIDFHSVDYRVRSHIEQYISNGKPPPGTKSAYRRISDAYGAYAYRLFFLWMERVSSARSGPKRWVPKGSMQNTETGIYGLLDDPYKMTLEPNTPAKGRRRRGQATETVAKYLSKLGIASDIKRQDLSAYHGALNITDSISKVVSNLADVGFGTSQAIPVIRGCLSDSVSPLFLEQPEIHLHPKAQGELANLICQTSKKRQVFVETHSEHMINRARILVARGELAPDDVKILYIDRSASGSHVKEIGLDESGDFTEDWPAGFFDERYQDSMKLLELKSKNSSIINIKSKKKI